MALGLCILYCMMHFQADRKCDCASGTCMAEDMYIEQLNDVIRHSTPKAGVAGFFAESIQGVGGTVQYPHNFLKRAFDIIHEKGGLCISDEVCMSLIDAM